MAPNFKTTTWHICPCVNNNEQPRLFGLCAFAFFTVRWVNLYQPHVCQLIPKVWTHNWANFHYIRVAIYVYRWSFESAVTSYLDFVFDWPFNNGWFSLDVIAAMLVYRTIEKVFWEFDSIIMQNTSHNLLLFCPPTWPSHHVTANHL